MKNQILIIALFIGQLGFAQQDRHFSMFFANPVQSNPAAAGHFGGDIQLFTNFRTQWFTVTENPFRSFSASVDGKLLNQQLNNGFIGAGINFFNDISGDSRYAMNIISVPINYSIELNKTSYLSVGIQPGLHAQKLSGEQLYFDNQWDGGSFNTAISSNENTGAYSQSKFDLGAGIYFEAAPREGRKIQLGVSGFHLTRQPVNFLVASEKLYRNVTVFAKGEIGSSNSNVSFHPAIFSFFQGPNFEITAGNNFVYQLRPASKHTMYFDGTSIGFGLYYRSTDALIANMTFTTGSFSVGASYDLNISGLSVASKGVGAFEMFLKFSPSLGSNRFGAPRIH